MTDVGKQQLSKEETLKLRNKYIGPNCEIFFKSDPLKIVRGCGQYLYEENGVRYLDCINNVAHVGHCHPTVVAENHKQMGLLCTNNRYLHDNIVQLAEKLTSLLPEPLSVCYFVNSGSEANDLALRLAQYYTQAKDVVILDHAYHGHVQSLIAVSPYKHNHPGCKIGLETKPDYVHVAPTPDTYRGKYRDTEYKEEELLSLYTDEVYQIVTNLEKNGRNLSAFICESLQSCGGQIFPPSGYLKEVYSIIHKAGGVCIADEVQTGFGRVGTHYWGFQIDGCNAIPDIVTVGKPMGNGHPISAVITTRAIADAFNQGPKFFSTFGGNPVSCAVALSVIDIIEKEGLREAAVLKGQQLINGLKGLQDQFPIIGDIRGIGMFVGIDLVLDRITREPAVTEAEWILWRLRDQHHIIMSLDGPYSNILKFKPPMVFSEDNVEELLGSLEEVLRDLGKMKNDCQEDAQ